MSPFIEGGRRVGMCWEGIALPGKWLNVCVNGMMPRKDDGGRRERQGRKRLRGRGNSPLYIQTSLATLLRSYPSFNPLSVVQCRLVDTKRTEEGARSARLGWLERHGLDETADGPFARTQQVGVVAPHSLPRSFSACLDTMGRLKGGGIITARHLLLDVKLLPKMLVKAWSVRWHTPCLRFWAAGSGMDVSRPSALVCTRRRLPKPPLG